MTSAIRKVIQEFYPESDLDDYKTKICCPFHNERSASLSINDEKNYFKCFGCEVGGDAINFVTKYVMEVEGDDCDYKKAVALIKQRTGLTVEEMKSVKDEEVKKANADEMPREQIVELVKATGFVANGYRKITDETNKFYQHLTKLDPNGNVIARYYPETNNEGKITGFKCRNHPKDFSYGKIGITGIKSQLSGQHKFNSGGKYVLIVGGEEDKAAAQQMLRNNQVAKGQGDFSRIPVVSPTTGEGSAIKQIAAQLEWLGSFQEIILGLDNDAAGLKAMREIANILPKEKVKIAKWTGKDPNQMLMEGAERQFLSDFYNAQQLMPNGIKTSAELMEAIMEELLTPRITLPDYMHELQDHMNGGIKQGRIVNVIGDTSAGKSSHVNNMVYHWIFNAPERVGVVSLEATAGQYGLEMLSIHLEQNLTWWADGHEVVDYLNKPEVQRLYENLFTDDYGEPRFVILDERDGDIKRLEKQLELLVNKYECKILIIDVLSDILRGSNGDMQEDHMKWQKNMVKNGITIINVLHTRKPPASNDKEFRKSTEYDALGSSSFVQSAAINIVINRDKSAECSVERNTTEVDMPKCRGGQTGAAGKWYYDTKTRKVYDLTKWLEGEKEANRPDIKLVKMDGSTEVIERERDSV